jgi:hypothetical protein
MKPTRLQLLPCLVAPIAVLLASTAISAESQSLSDEPSIDQDFTSDAPCGPRTLVMVHTNAGDRYVFCSHEGSIAVIEILADGDAARSLVGKSLSPVDLLARVLPLQTAVPDHVLKAMAGEGSASGRDGYAAPWVVGVPRARPSLMGATSPSKAACARPQLPFTPSLAFFQDPTDCGIMDTQVNTSDNSGHFQVTASLRNIPGEGSALHAGPHTPLGNGEFYEHTGDDEDGGARYGFMRIKACDGSVRARGWRKKSPTEGSFVSLFDVTVEEGETSGFYIWANPFHSLWMGYDADDMRLRADANGQASFGALIYYAKYAWGTQCGLNF